MSLTDLIGEKVIDSEKHDVAVSSLAGEGKVLGIYFSAHWCPPCRAFTPQLVEWYRKIKGGPNGSSFEIVFVSSDRDQGMFDEYFQEMPWHALPFQERMTKVRVDGRTTACVGVKTRGAGSCSRYATARYKPCLQGAIDQIYIAPRMATGGAGG